MKKILLTAATAATILTSNAYAAEGDFFVKAGGGWDKLNKTKTLGISAKSNNGAFLELGAGYHIMDNARVDLTFTHLFNPEHKVGGLQDEDDATNKKVSLKIKGEVNSLLLNGFVDVVTFDEFKIFVGAGVGMSQVKAKATYSGHTDTTDNTSHTAKQKYNPAFAGYLGGSYEFAQGVAAELTYSYRDMGKTKKFKDTDYTAHYKGHHIGVGVRFDI